MCNDAVYESHAEDDSVYAGMLRSCPELALHSGDEYMATLLQYISDEPDSLARPELADVETIFVLCGYGQSRSIPYYIYMSPKADEKQIDQLCTYKPRYETLMSRDSSEMQVEKLVLTDMLHGS